MFHTYQVCDLFHLVDRSMMIETLMGIEPIPETISRWFSYLLTTTNSTDHLRPPCAAVPYHSRSGRELNSAYRSPSIPDAIRIDFVLPSSPPIRQTKFFWKELHLRTLKSMFIVLVNIPGAFTALRTEHLGIQSRYIISMGIIIIRTSTAAPTMC